MISRTIRGILGLEPKWKAWLVLTASATALYHLLCLIPLLGLLFWMLTSMPFLSLADRLGLGLFTITPNTMPLSYFLSVVYWFVVFGVVCVPILTHGRARVVAIVAGLGLLLFHVGFSWHAWSEMPF